MRPLHGLALLLATATPAVASASAVKLPFENPHGVARTQQAVFNEQVDPTATCHAITTYAVQCHVHTPSAVVETLTKAGPHRLRISTIAGKKVTSKVSTLKPGDVLYADV